jgi:hypothetical protein
MAIMVFTKRLTSDGHSRLFSIRKSEAGWEIREERDSRIVRRSHCDDWHHVERRRAAFEWEVDALERAGWIEE